MPKNNSDNPQDKIANIATSENFEGSDKKLEALRNDPEQQAKYSEILRARNNMKQRSDNITEETFPDTIKKKELNLSTEEQKKHPEAIEKEFSAILKNIESSQNFKELLNNLQLFNRNEDIAKIKKQEIEEMQLGYFGLTLLQLDDKDKSRGASLDKDTFKKVLFNKNTPSEFRKACLHCFLSDKTIQPEKEKCNKDLIISAISEKLQESIQNQIGAIPGKKNAKDKLREVLDSSTHQDTKTKLLNETREITDLLKTQNKKIDNEKLLDRFSKSDSFIGAIKEFCKKIIDAILFKQIPILFKMSTKHLNKI
jgi:hypothetical protein